MNMQKALSYTRQAIEDYHMISDHDVIAVGLSGGKDSFTLLSVLARLQTFYPHSFTLHAIILMRSQSFVNPLTFPIIL